MTARRALYDNIGLGYAALRRPDPRLLREIVAALGPGHTLLNVGAGSGSYEPDDRRVVAVEPALAMISQRAAGAAPAIRGVAETLPIADRAVDSAMAVMTAHHWDDVTVGIDELVRVTRKTFVLVTLDVEAFANHWMVTDYAPEIFELHAALFPPMNLLTERIPCVHVTPWDVPCDCTDWFMAALWSRPELYLRPDVRAASSVWHQLPADTVQSVITRLSRDLKTGVWDQRHGALRSAATLDVGVRIIRGVGSGDSSRDVSDTKSDDALCASQSGPVPRVGLGPGRARAMRHRASVDRTGTLSNMSDTRDDHRCGLPATEISAADVLPIDGRLVPAWQAICPSCEKWWRDTGVAVAGWTAWRATCPLGHEWTIMRDR